MLKNAYLLAKIGADTAENERNFAKIFAALREPPACRGAGLVRAHARRAAPGGPRVLRRT